MSWCDEQMVAFDVETTSPDPETARIVSAAVARVGGGKPTLALDWLADPGMDIPEEATAVHGITTERAREHGQPAALVVEEIIQALNGWGTGALVAFNARFDLTIADREARRHGLVPLTDRREILVVDPLVLDKWLDRYRKGSRKLDALCAHYHVRLDEAHEASSDAIAAARLAYRIGHHADVVRRARGHAEAQELVHLRRRWDECRHDLPALHALQTELAAVEAVRLQEYFRKGNPAKGVPPQPDAYCEPEWPVITYLEPEAAVA